MESTRTRFARHGLRCTRQRQAIYDALAACTSHPTADELFQMVALRSGPISLATVYNTLEALTTVGLCSKLPTTSGAIRYDADMREHLHVRCKATGRLRDVPAALGQQLLDAMPRNAVERIEREMGVHVCGFQVQLIGEPPVPPI